MIQIAYILSLSICKDHVEQVEYEQHPYVYPLDGDSCCWHDRIYVSRWGSCAGAACRTQYAGEGSD